MKTLIAAGILALASGGSVADWEDAWRNPDLSTNFDSHVEAHRDLTRDPVESAYRGNSDLYAGGAADAIAGKGPTSYDRFVRGNPDVKNCGCI